MRPSFLFVFAQLMFGALLAASAHASEEACTLMAPPQDVREVARTKFHRIVSYPQWIDASFSGCQRNWVLFYNWPPRQAPRIDTYFEGGEIVRVVSYSDGPAPIVENDCQYRDGFLVPAPSVGAALCPSAKEIAEETKKMRPR